MAVTNLGGGGMRSTATGLLNQQVQGYQQQTLQNNAIAAEQQAKQKEINDQMHAQAIQQLFDQYTSQGMSIRKAIEDNYDVVFGHTSALMGGNTEGADQYLRGYLGTEETPAEQGARSVYDQARQRIKKGDPFLDYLDKETVPIEVPTVTPGRNETVDMSLNAMRGKLQDLIENQGYSPAQAIRDLPAVMLSMDYDTFKGTGENEKRWLDTRSQLWKQLSLPGEYKPADAGGRDNEILANAILSGGTTPADQPTQEEKVIPVNNARAVELANMTTAQLIETDEYKANKDRFDFTKMPLTGDVGNQAELRAEWIRNWTPTRVSDAMANADGRGGAYIAQRTPSPITGTADGRSAGYFTGASKHINVDNVIEYAQTIKEDSIPKEELQTIVDFQIPEKMTTKEVLETNYVMKSGVLTDLHNSLNAIGEQAGPALSPRLYDAFVKEVSDRLDISEAEASIALKNAQTQQIYASMMPTAPGLQELNPAQRSTVSQVQDMLASAGVIFDEKTRTAKAPSTEGWFKGGERDKVLQLISTSNAFLRASPGIATTKYMLELGNGDTIEVLVPSPLGQATLGTQGTTTNEMDQRFGAAIQAGQ